MSEAAFIAGDWGTSRLRLYLCDPAGNVLARGSGEGVLLRYGVGDAQCTTRQVGSR